MSERNFLGQQIQGYTIVQKIGSGGYGTVYLGEKEDLGKKYQSAIKYISIPDAEGYEVVLQDYGYDKAAAQAHFEKMVEGISAEINMLLELSKKDNRYIVAYYDHDIQQSEDPLRFDIFLRMEYLTPLNRYIRQNGITLGEVIKLGLNMCDALSLCHNSGVMHRDIKEANIFVSESQNFKLGDFGVAKVALETTQAGSIKGTASYMAPEIYLREPYDSSVDIYSLGIVLYKLLNNLRLPFLPNAPAPYTVDDRNLAETRRLKGEMPPLPANAQNALGEIVVKACSAKVDRYARAEDMKADLQAFLRTLSAEEYDAVVIAPSLNPEEPYHFYTSSQQPVNPYDEETETGGATVTMGADNASGASSGDHNPNGGKKKKKKGKLVLVIALLILLLAGGVAGCILYLNITDPINKFETAVLKGDFTSAAQLYQDAVIDKGDDAIEEATEFLLNRAEELQTQYINNEIEYEDALTQLQEMGKLGIVSSSELESAIGAINELRTSRVAYVNAQTSIEAGDWETAISELHKVIQSDENYTEAQTLLADAVRSYKEEVLATMSDYEATEDYSGAISALQAALKVVPDDADFETKISDYQQKISDSVDLAVAAIIQDANNVITTDSDYLSALESLRAANKKYPNREDIQEAISEVEDQYIDFVFQSVDALVAEKKYDNAVSTLNDLKSNVSDTATVTQKISEVEGMRPVELSTLVVIDSRDYSYSKDMFTDSFGYNYDGHYFFNAGYGGYSVYNLNGQYTTFSGTLVAGTNTSSDASMTLMIYVDDKLVYTKENFTKRSGSVDFSVDVSGATKLSINTSADYKWDNRLCYIVNTALEK